MVFGFDWVLSGLQFLTVCFCLRLICSIVSWADFIICSKLLISSSCWFLESAIWSETGIKMSTRLRMHSKAESSRTELRLDAAIFRRIEKENEFWLVLNRNGSPSSLEKRKKRENRKKKRRHNKMKSQKKHKKDNKKNKKESKCNIARTE